MINELLDEATDASVEVREHIFKNEKLKGLYLDGVITINKNIISTTTESICVIAEELGHHFTSFGNILNQRDVRSRKQEKRARNWAYERLVTLFGFVHAFETGVQNRFELAEYFGVTEEFIEETIKHYQEKHGEYKIIENYIIFFNPLKIGKMFD
ncbi:hypothetical protein PMSD_11750 [Paenibacillus macquariensis subsp. defensor]|nr:hypothetical protein PMSD_11750 [Paenibacillus macquariensis subsp. defensor]